MAAKIFRINYKSDFILTMNSEAGWTIPFCIKFWTSIPMRAYYVGFDGTTYTHCAYDPSEPTKLLVQFDDHHLPIGNLHFQIAYHFTVEDFPNNTEDEVFNATAITTEIDGETYQVMLDFTGETAPGIDFNMPSVGVTSVNGKIGAVTLNAEDVGAQPTIEDLATIRNGAAAGATAVQPATLQEGLATKQNVIEDLATIRSGAAAGATAVQPATLQEGLATKQDVISDLATIRSGAAAGATAVQPAVLTPIESALQTIEAVIPSAASSQNQLADKNFVNSSISTNTANFVGTYNSLAELQAVQNPTNNDYGFVIETDAQGNEYYDRYKYVAASQQWIFEYKVESTPFTAAQWAAIQSGITSALVTKLNALPTAQQLSNQLAAKQDTITDLATIRSGAAAGAAAYQKPGAGIPSTDLAVAVQTSLERADKAAVRPYNTQSPDGMGYLVLDKDATFASQVTTANTIYEIRYDYDLNAQTVTIPSNCVLKFNGGSLANGAINLTDTSIIADKVIFGDDLSIAGKCLQVASPEWFSGSDADKIEKAINTFCVVQLAARDYLINRTINAQHSFRLNGYGIPSNFGDYATPSKSDDYSSSRLIPIADIGSILACVAPLGGFVSLVLSGVSFVRPVNETWFNDYKTATANVHGFAFSTPGGPSRPIIVENCNFKCLNCGIYIYSYNENVSVSTNVSILHITGCNFSLNRQGIHAEGIRSIVGATIDNNVIEWNTDYGIYLYNDANSSFASEGVVTDYLEITNNLIEGQANPVFVSIVRGTLLFKGNFIENDNGASITIDGFGASSYYQTFTLDSNFVSNTTNVVYNLKNLTVIDNDNGFAEGTLLLLNASIKGDTRKKIITRTNGTSAYTPSLTNSNEPVLKLLIEPNYIYNDEPYYCKKAEAHFVLLKLNEQLPAGNYIISTFTQRLAISLSVVGASTAIFNTTSLSPTGLPEPMLCEKSFSIAEAIPANSTIRIYVQANGEFYSGFAIYADNGQAHDRYSFEPRNFVSDTIVEIINPKIGVYRYDNLHKKAIRLANVNGNVSWKDFAGFTPSVSRGFTDVRPTSELNGQDVGYYFFDRLLNKNIHFTFKQGNQLAHYWKDMGVYYADNTLSIGDFMQISLWSPLVLNGKVQVSFVKSDVDDTDSISVEDELTYYNDGYYRAVGFFPAPDPSVYTKIKFVNNAGGYRDFTLYNAEKLWIEADGAMAGVLRHGATADRPASSDIYVGFEYFDTTLGKPIYYNGTSWVDATGTAV